MKLYADLPLQRTLQIATDVLLLVWIWAWWRIAGTVRDATLALTRPGEETDQAATSMASQLARAGERLDDAPLIGGGIASPFDGAASAAESLAAAGRSSSAAVETLAFWLWLCILAIPVLLGIAYHLPRRVRFVRAATAGRRFVDSAADLDLFALRALANQPLHVLARISDDPAGDWRERDPDVIDRLARLELRSVGLAPEAVSTADR